MKIARFIDEQGTEHLGCVVSADRARLIEGDLFGTFRVTDKEVRMVRLRPPVRPPNIFGIGLNYVAHAAEGGREIPDKPLVFMKPTTAVVACGEPIRLPTSAPDEVDFEGELALIVGRPAKSVSIQSAMEYCLGFTCANDVTARDCQKRLDKQWVRAKGFDSFCPLGPWLVTPDEFDPGDAVVASRLNGEETQNAPTAQMIFSCAELLGYLSHQFTLLPGTIICTGTPAGVGWARTPQRFLRRGDRVEVTVSGIGTLWNPVAPCC